MNIIRLFDSLQNDYLWQHWRRGEDRAAGAGQPGQGLHHGPQLSGRLQTHREGESDHF